MTRDEAIEVARNISDLDVATCGKLVQKLVVSRKLSRVVRALDDLILNRDHDQLAQNALRNLGFTPQ